MFDFTPNAPDVAGPASYYLDPATFQSTTTPQPLLPEVGGSNLLLPLSAAVLFGGGVAVIFWRRRRHSALPG